MSRYVVTLLSAQNLSDSNFPEAAFSEAAVLFLRDHPAAQKYLARLEKKHEKGKALTILAQQLARAVYYMLTRQVAFDREMFFQR
jgi:hypothetical protein